MKIKIYYINLFSRLFSGKNLRTFWDIFYKITSYSILQRQNDRKYWPEEWKKIYYKSYSKNKEIAGSLFTTNEIESLITSRRSSRKFNNYKISSADILRILLVSSGIASPNNGSKMQKRTYPSPGSLYSLNIYPIVLNGDGISRGIYHYNVLRNSLEVLKEGDFREKLLVISPQEWIKYASVVFIITTSIDRLYPKYNRRSYRFAFIEAGHLGQNFYLESFLLGFNCCAIGSFLDEELIKLLDLTNSKEAPIYAITIGK